METDVTNNSRNRDSPRANMRREDNHQNILPEDLKVQGWERRRRRVEIRGDTQIRRERGWIVRLVDPTDDLHR